MGCAASSGAPPDDAWAAAAAVDGSALGVAPLKWGAQPEPEPEPAPAPQLSGATIALADLEEVRILGVGSFGAVTLVRCRGDGRTYALKRCHKHRIAQLKQRTATMQEREALALLAHAHPRGHPFVTRLVQTFRTQDSLYFLTEAVLGGELFTLLKRKVRLSDSEARFYVANIALFLEAAHAERVAYRDIKPENILLDDRGYLVVADFGFAKQLPRAGARTHTLCGTPAYMAPEVILHKGHGLSADWWAVGVLAYEMLSGYNPFQGSSSAATYQNIIQAGGSLHFAPTFTTTATQFIRDLLNVEPAKRLGHTPDGEQTDASRGTAAVKSHAWFAVPSLFDFDAMLQRTLPTPHTPEWDGDTDTRNFAQYSEADLHPLPSEDYTETEPGWDRGF